jgi:hypothetical protein
VQCHSAPRNAKFSNIFPRNATLHRATPNFSAHTHTNIFPRNATLHRATPNFSARTRTPIFFHAMPLCTAQRQILAHTPAHQYFSTYHKLFTAHHAFLVRPPAHIHFYAHQFLVNSAAEIGAFA